MKNAAIAFLAGLLTLSMSVDNSPRIGHVYMEQVLSRMDEAKEMNRILDRFMMERQAELEKQKSELEAKYVSFQTKEKKGELTDAGRIIASSELKATQAAYDAALANAEQELAQKRSDLIRPIAQQIQKAMKEVAAKEAYTHVFNSADGTGNSIIIVAPEGDDLTLKVMHHLGVKLD
ncbi:MAG: OmpH family outer membrane protein [Flavobacteriales bacterium]|nr:OmpH family outer membrane protein [Flavobacteriales bacterium]